MFCQFAFGVRNRAFMYVFVSKCSFTFRHPFCDYIELICHHDISNMINISTYIIKYIHSCLSVKPLWHLWLCQGFFTITSRFLYDYVKVSLRACQGFFTIMSWFLYDYVQVSLRLCQGFFTIMSRFCYDYVKVSLRLCHGFFTIMSRFLYDYVKFSLLNVMVTMRICNDAHLIWLHQNNS